jgi:predicted esterase
MRRAAALALALLSAGCVQSTASFPEEPADPPRAAPAEQNAVAPAPPEGETQEASTTPSSSRAKSSSRSRAGSPESPGDLAPITGAPFVELAVPNHRPAVVSLPLGATSRRPVLVAAHGAGDRPEWQCHVWRGIVGDRAFVLCPRGFPTNPYVPPEHTGYFYTTHHALAREIGLAFEALVKRFPDHVDPKDPVFAGFSQGAIFGALVLPRHPVRFARAALVEGGYGFFHEWNIHAAQTWTNRGGVRVLLACGRVRCVEQATPTAYYMKRGGLDARILHAEGAGHSYGGRMEIAVREAFGWLIEGDPRFAGGAASGNAP